jgi:hypothetical protein
MLLRPTRSWAARPTVYAPRRGAEGARSYGRYERVPCVAESQPHSEAYLKTKQQEDGAHLRVAGQSDPRDVDWRTILDENLHCGESCLCLFHF